MNAANLWITFGVLAVAFSAFAIPHGFHLKKATTADEPKSLKNSKELSYDERQAYKAIIYKITNELTPTAKIRIDDSIQGVETNKNHDIDISIRTNKEGQEILNVIKTYSSKDPIDDKQLKDWYSIITDIGASHGTIISNSGFTESAKHLAPSYAVELLSIIDAESHMWKDDIKIPVLHEALNFTFTYEFTMHLKERSAFDKDILKWIVSQDDGKTQSTLSELSISLWDDKGTRSGSIKFDNISVLVDGNKWIKLIDFVSGCVVDKKGYIKYFEPEKYRAIKDHLSERIIPSHIAVKLGPFTTHEGWHKVNDIENIKKRTKGTLIIVEDIVGSIQGFGPSTIHIEKMD